MRNMKKIFLLLLVLAAFSKDSFAQQDPQYSQYMFNGLLLNPAYAGSRELVSATLLYRKQWVQIDGAPQTGTVSIHLPSRDLRHGFGFSFFQDRLGITRQTGLNLSYAYRIPVGPGTLALGLQGGILNHQNRWSESITVDPDNGLPMTNQSAILPNVGTGAYFNTQRFYAGVSMPNLLKNTYKNPNSVGGTIQAKQARHVFATAGVVLKISESLDLKPSVLLKYTKNAPLELDLNASLLIKKMFWIGASYRTKDAVVFIFEYIHKNQFRFGYAYDLTTTNLGTYNSGSHELMLGMDFIAVKERIKTPRYF